MFDSVQYYVNFVQYFPFIYYIHCEYSYKTRDYIRDNDNREYMQQGTLSISDPEKAL